MTVPQEEQQPTGNRGLSGRWLAIGSAAWAIALVVAAVFSFRTDPPTVREQRTIAQAAPVVDRAIGELVAAGQGPDVAVEITEPTLDVGCRLNAGWDGATLERSVIVRALPAAAPAVLDRVADRLPAGYRATSRHRDDGSAHRLRADAGDFVAVLGTITSPGVVTLTARTGCRPQSPGYEPAVVPRSGTGSDAERALTELRAEEIDRHGVTAVRCPDGESTAYTERASGRATLGEERRTALTGRDGTVVVMDTATQVVVSTGPATLTVRVDEDRLTVAYTRTCAPE